MTDSAVALPALRSAMLGLANDAATAETVKALRRAGTPVVLLKGPAIAARLYADGAPRPYGDIDLLVSPQRAAAAGRVFAGLGYRRARDSWAWQEPPSSNQVWKRPPAAIDLHQTLRGCNAAPQAVWAVLSRRCEELSVGGEPVAVLDDAGLALLVALHASSHGPDERKPLRDLERGIVHLPAGAWEEATRLAHELGAVSAMGHGLGMVEGGRQLQAALGLPSDIPRSLRVRDHLHGRLGALSLQRIADAATPGQRAGIIASRAAPPPDIMRRVFPLAGRGTAGLVVSYLVYPFLLARHAPGAVAHWLKARRANR